MKQETIAALSSWSQFLEFFEKIIPTIIATFIVLSLMIVIIRFGLLFWHYINTGNVGDFEDDSGFMSLMNGNMSDFWSAIFIGPHPGAIFVDFLLFAVISMFIGISWPVMVIILPILLLAMFLRKRIARKQEFIAKLDGTYIIQESDNE